MLIVNLIVKIHSQKVYDTINIYKYFVNSIIQHFCGKKKGFSNRKYNKLNNSQNLIILLLITFILAFNYFILQYNLLKNEWIK